MFTIGVDIGGTNVKIGMVKEGEIIDKISIKSEKTFSLLINTTCMAIKDLLAKNKITIKQVKGIGIGCPGLIDTKNGIVKFSCNLNWTNVNVFNEIKKYFSIPVKISNDANVATLAETLYGAGKGLNNSVMFTIGTGVGGGVVIDKKLYEGGYSSGTELGHVTLIASGEKCSCGRRGCIETYASATALIKQTNLAMKSNKRSLMWKFCSNDIKNIDGRTAFECAKNGDKTANEVIDKYISYLSESIMSMLNIFRPDIFIIGGGVSGQGKYLTDKIKDYCKRFNYGYKGTKACKIKTAILKNDAGIIGAACLFE